MNFKHFLQNIPDLECPPLKYVLEVLKYKHIEGTIWLELGVCRGRTVNYISRFTPYKVYGFDSFVGLPWTTPPWYKGQFACSKQNDRGEWFHDPNFLPEVNENVVLIKGWFDPKLAEFVNNHPQKISFIHMDCDIYSSTKYALNTFKNQLSEGCIIVFDELIHYDGCEKHQLLAFYEFVSENDVEFEWIGRLKNPSTPNILKQAPGKYQAVAVKLSKEIR